MLQMTSRYVRYLVRFAFILAVVFFPWLTTLLAFLYKLFGLETLLFTLVCGYVVYETMVGVGLWAQYAGYISSRSWYIRYKEQVDVYKQPVVRVMGRFAR